MWRGIQNPCYNIMTEIFVRIIILLIVCIMHGNLEPHIRHITEKELRTLYNLPRKDSITPPWMMVLIVIFVPLFVLLIHSNLTGNYNDYTQALLAWTLACAINAFLTETGKLVVGRLRPDFYYRCFPDGKMTKDLECTGSLKEVIEGRKSFPSGHSSFSFCSLGFVSVWLFGILGVLSRSRGQALRVVTCLLPLVIAGVVAMSRYCDNHHHWEDIVVGSMMGLSTSYFCYRQYYYPLDSLFSGNTYNSLTLQTLFTNSEEQCCTRTLGLSDTESRYSDRCETELMKCSRRNKSET